MIRGSEGREECGFVYFFGVDNAHLIKIGWSSRPTDRLMSLRAFCVRPVTILAAAPGYIRDERAIQNHFIDGHARFEWFRPSSELWGLINTVCDTGAIPKEFCGGDYTNCPIRSLVKVRKFSHAHTTRSNTIRKVMA